MGRDIICIKLLWIGPIERGNVRISSYTTKVSNRQSIGYQVSWITCIPLAYDVWESLSISVRNYYTNPSSFCQLLEGQNLRFSSSRELRMGRDHSKSVKRVFLLCSEQVKIVKSIKGITNLSLSLVNWYYYKASKNLFKNIYNMYILLSWNFTYFYIAHASWSVSCLQIPALRCQFVT
jgi:hypothetical protein